jgi:hypothetical protein
VVFLQFFSAFGAFWWRREIAAVYYTHWLEYMQEMDWTICSDKELEFEKNWT